MNILAINSASSSLFVALKYGGKTYQEKVSNTEHSQSLMRAIDNTLKMANAKLSDIDLFGVVVGPGSFTGIRIGLATIKAFSFVTGKAIIGINALELLAFAGLNGTKLDKIICGINAGSGLVYGAGYDSEINEFIKPATYTIEEVKAFISGGTKFVIYEDDEVLVKEFESAQKITFDNNTYLEFIEKKAENTSNILSAKTIMPIYLRLSQAERELELKEKASKEQKNG